MKRSGLILAAGLSSRMGEFKPLMRIGGKTLIEYTAESLLAAAGSVTVVLGYREDEIRRVLRAAYPAEKVRFAFNPAYATTDMLASVKAGVAALDECDAFYLLPGDMPAVGADTLFALTAALESMDAKVAFPTVEGYRKHPPLIRFSCAGDILSYAGEGGLRGIWRGYEGRIAEVPVQDRGCLLDADRMDDFLTLADYLQQKQRFEHNASEAPNSESD